jgi:hypothetical protein
MIEQPGIFIGGIQLSCMRHSAATSGRVSTRRIPISQIIATLSWQVMVKTVKRSVNALPAVVVYSQLWRMFVALRSFGALRFVFGPIGHRHGRNDPRLSRRVLNGFRQDPAVIAIKSLASTLLRVLLGDIYYGLLWLFRTALGAGSVESNFTRKPSHGYTCSCILVRIGSRRPSIHHKYYICQASPFLSQVLVCYLGG